MVAETHPHDIELFEYAEDELPQARRDEIAAHLATCGVCAEQVRQAAAGREALRETTLLELPEGRREEILRNLPEPERSTGERRGFFTKQLLAGIAALLVVAALAAVLVKTGGNSGMESSAERTAGGAAEATPTSGGGGKTEDAQVADLFAGGSRRGRGRRPAAQGIRRLRPAGSRRRPRRDEGAGARSPRRPRPRRRRGCG